MLKVTFNLYALTLHLLIGLGMRVLVAQGLMQHIKRRPFQVLVLLGKMEQHQVQPHHPHPHSCIQHHLHLQTHLAFQ